MFKHPQYYKNLRKLYRSRNRDQAISEQDPTGSKERAPGTGHQASNIKPQATSEPEPGSGSASLKHQATSLKP